MAAPCPRGLWIAALVFSLAGGLPATGRADAVEPESPAISIIIDDLGNEMAHGEAALALPGPVTLAFLPHTPHARELAKRAHAIGKEVMLHLPMESHNGYPLGPGALTLDLTEQEFLDTLRGDLDSLPYVVGINNHMGSLLTRHPGAMGWLMKELRTRGNLFFVDSRTTRQTVAEQVARERGVPAARRNVFLDNNRDPAAIHRQFRQLVKMAQHQGYAIGIGHPYMQTMAVLKQELTQLGRSGVRLISTSELIALQERDPSWPGSSFPSPQVVKSSKR